MKADRRDVLRELEPPPGGPARMRAKFAGATRRNRVRAWWLGPVAVGLIAAVTIVHFRPADDAGSEPEVDALLASAEFDRLLGRETEPVDLVVTRGEVTLAVRELETREPKVRFFRIEDSSPGDPNPSP